MYNMYFTQSEYRNKAAFAHFSFSSLSSNFLAKQQPFRYLTESQCFPFPRHLHVL